MMDARDQRARRAKVFRFAAGLYKDREQVRAFLNRPHPMLEGRTPLDRAVASAAGADRVINLLGRMAYSGGV